MNEETISQNEQVATANRVNEILSYYGIKTGKITFVKGPSVTRYRVSLLDSRQVRKIQTLESDLVMSLTACGVRIIPPKISNGKYVYIEIPNEKPELVTMRTILDSQRFQDENDMQLPVALGYTISNEVFMFDLAKAPHLLVGGACGTGKSVTVNAIIASLLHKKKPSELKFVLVDPKMVEFSPYKPLWNSYLDAFSDTERENLIITDCDDLIVKLNALVAEMENRYTLLMDAGVSNIKDYNAMITSYQLDTDKQVTPTLRHYYLPYIIVIIDEYGDFIMRAGKQVETPIVRITQKAHTVGVHMILATQRPSVNIVTGVIKANIPTRIALRTQRMIDSRTILDAKGAEQLIGRGDMLYSDAHYNITRVQGAYIGETEINNLVNHIASQDYSGKQYTLPFCEVKDI